MNRSAKIVPAAKAFGRSGPQRSTQAFVAELETLINQVERAHSVGARWPGTPAQQRQVQAVLLRILSCDTAPLRVFVEAARFLKASVDEHARVADHARSLAILQRAVEDPIQDRDLSALLVHWGRRPDDLPSTACLASRWRMSERTASCWLRRELGVAVPGLRVVLRCRLAVSALLTTGELVSQVAYQCGYEHASQLDRDFDRALGVTPSEFRKLALAYGIASSPKEQPLTAESVNKTVNRSVKEYQLHRSEGRSKMAP